MESQNVEVGGALAEEVRHVPLWVKGIVAGGVVLFAVQMFSFSGSLTDAIQKHHASTAFDKGEYAQAIDLYGGLHSRFPKDKVLIKKLGFAHYRAGQYVEALRTFDLLADVKMSKSDVGEINAAISDSAEKLGLKSK